MHSTTPNGTTSATGKNDTSTQSQKRPQAPTSKALYATIGLSPLSFVAAQQNTAAQTER